MIFIKILINKKKYFHKLRNRPFDALQWGVETKFGDFGKKFASE